MLARVDEVLRSSLRRADAVVTATNAAGQTAQRELLRDLAAADALLRRRLARYASSDERFTPQSLLSYQRQIVLVRRRVERSLSGIVGRCAGSARVAGYAETFRLMAALEQRFSGIVRPLRLRQAQTMSASRSETSLLSQRATSVDRYGNAMIAEFERRMRRGLIAGLSQRDMVNELCGHGGPAGTVSLAARETPAGVVRTVEEEIPEGLFVRYRSWAWRIVRTETARAYSVARMDGLFEQRQEFPALRKKILATFDNRTAMDSVLVHGQIRRLEEPFVDGAGRVYMQPPARPNDREVVIPWLPEWEETPITRNLPPRQIEAARARAGAGIDPAHQEARLDAARAASAAQRRGRARAVPAPPR